MVSDGRVGCVNVELHLRNVRVDRWMWAARLFPTRTASSAACEGGHVKVNGSSAKPSTKIKVGDMLDVPGPDQKRRIEVVGLIEKRVGAVVAATLLVDHTPRISKDENEGVIFHRDRDQVDRPRKIAVTLTVCNLVVESCNHHGTVGLKSVMLQLHEEQLLKLDAEVAAKYAKAYADTAPDLDEWGSLDEWHKAATSSRAESIRDPW